MSSSFQTKSELEFEDIFSNVFALYCALKSSGAPRSIRRAELKQGEVTAEAIDFLADVEIKCKRILNPTQYRLVLRYALEDRYDSVPKSLKQSLGELFDKNDLNYDGAYRVLYYRAKNNQLADHEQGLQFPEGE